jgi:hypothetical protein
VSRDVTFHESVPGSTLLTAAVSAAEPAVISSTSSSSSSINAIVTPAAELVDSGRLSMIDSLLNSDTESDSDDDEREAAEPSQAQSVSPQVVVEPLISQLPVSLSVASESPASHQSASAPLAVHMVGKQLTGHGSNSVNRSVHFGNSRRITRLARQSRRASSSTRPSTR